MKILKLKPIRLSSKKKRFPILQLKSISDFKWQLMSLSDRLHNPEKYSAENIKESVERLKQWLFNHLKEATAEELELFNELAEIKGGVSDV